MPISRRTFMASTTALAATPLIGSTPLLAKAPLVGVQAPGVYRYKVGEFEITALNDGFFNRPAEGFVKNADAAAVNAELSNAFMATGAVKIPFTVLAVNTGSKLVLLDTGTGGLGAPTAGLFAANLKAAGINPDDVDTIIISHFHPDHISGIRPKEGLPTFKNAEVMVPTPEWAFWMDDAKMAAAPEAAQGAFKNVRRVFGPMAKDVKQYKWGDELVTGITAIAAPGHTPGHTAFAVASGKDKLLVLSDTTNHPALFATHPDWMAIFDMDGETAKQTRYKLLDMAAADKMQVAAYHAPFPATGNIVKKGTGYEFVPAKWTTF